MLVCLSEETILLFFYRVVADQPVEQQPQPGTGKTTTNVIMAEGLAQCGKVIVYTTPTNVARDVAINSFLRVTELADDQIVRFNGGYQVGPLQMDQDGVEQRLGDQELMNDVWELYERREMNGFDDQLSRYNFETQLDKFMDSVRSSPTHELHSMAKEYFQKKKELSEARVTGCFNSPVRRTAVAAGRNKSMARHCSKKAARAMATPSPHTQTWQQHGRPKLKEGRLGQGRQSHLIAEHPGRFARHYSPQPQALDK